MCVKPISLHPGAARGCTVPCGQCIECRLKRSREWALRCVHEASLYDENSFVTLTYEDRFLPGGGTLVKRDFQDFMRRLRKEYGRVRYFHAGEYGERNGRPHYHALLFGLSFPDAVRVGDTQSGYPQFSSERLSAVWTYGHATIGCVTFESAQYVARYCVKKVTGARAVGHYQGRAPEYATMSRRPGIGAGWFAKYREEVVRDDSVLARGNEVLPPRFYLKQLEEAQLEVMKARRARKYGERCRKWDSERLPNGKLVEGGMRERAARELIAVERLKMMEARCRG